MKRVKAVWIGAAIFMAASISHSTFAQDAPAPRQGGARQGRGFGAAPSLANLPLPYLSWALSLTDEQKTKIQAVQEKVRTDMQDLRRPDASGQRPDRATLQPKVTALNDQAKKDIEAVLTPAQAKKADSLVASAGTYNAIGIPLAVVGDLKLTADQDAKLTAIATAATKEQETTMKSVAEARSSGDQQKMQDLMQTMLASRQATRDKAFAILTDEQKAAITQYEKEHPRGNRGGRQPGAGASSNPA